MRVDGDECWGGVVGFSTDCNTAFDILRLADISLFFISTPLAENRVELRKMTKTTKKIKTPRMQFRASNDLRQNSGFHNNPLLQLTQERCCHLAAGGVLSK